MTSEVRQSQLDQKGIKNIKAIYRKYKSRECEIKIALKTIQKFHIPMNEVIVDELWKKSWFYWEQANKIEKYLNNRLERTTGIKRKVLIEKVQNKYGATIKGSWEVQFLRPVQ